MAKYRPLKTSFWKDDWISTLTPSEKLLYLYLISNPHTNLCGIYSVSIRYIAFETGLPTPDVQRILQKFTEEGKVAYEGDWVILANYQKHQSKSPFVKRGIEREMAEIPQYIAEMADGLNTVSTRVEKPIPKLKPKLISKDIRTATDLSVAEPSANFSGKKLEKKALMLESQFMTFWYNYPRKESKSEAKKIFMKLSYELFEPMLAALQIQKESEGWKKGFIPHASTWLHQKRWEDEVFELSDSKRYIIKVRGQEKEVSKAEYEAYKARTNQTNL